MNFTLNPNDIWLKPKILYKIYKLYNAKQEEFLKNIGKNLETKF